MDDPLNQRRNSAVDLPFENESAFSERVRSSIHAITVDSLDHLAESDVLRLAAIKDDYWGDFNATGRYLEDLASLKAFCVMNIPLSATLPQNDSWLEVLAHEHLIAFRRLIGATNEDSARRASSPNGYPHNCRYACEWRRIAACEMICATDLPCSIENIPTQKGFPIGGNAYNEIVEFLKNGNRPDHEAPPREYLFGHDEHLPSSSQKHMVRDTGKRRLANEEGKE